MLMIDLENNFYSATSLYAVILQILVMMLDRFFYIKVKTRSIETECIGPFAWQSHIPHHLFDSNHDLLIHRNPLHNKHFFWK